MLSLNRFAFRASLQEQPYYPIIYFFHSVCQYLLGLVFGNASSVLASTVIMAR